MKTQYPDLINYGIHTIFIVIAALLISTKQNNNTLYAEEVFTDLKKTFPASNINIIFTGEESGYLEPCGCSDIVIGGLSKRHTLINQLRNDDEDCILLSLGDLPKAVGRQDEIKMETFIEALGRMGYIAHNIGEKDINIGLELLDYLSQITNVIFLSSNIESNGLNIKPYIIKEININGTVVRIGILGILSPNLVGDDYQTVEVGGPVESLTSVLSELEGRTDFLILLSHAEIDYSLELAKIFPEFDLIISGHGIDEPELYIKKIRDTYVIPVGEKGKQLGMITFPIDYLNKRGGSALNNANRASNYNTSFTEEKLKYYGLHDYFTPTPIGPAIDIIMLDERYDKSQEIEGLLRVYQERLRDEELVKQMSRTGPPSGHTFIGNEICSLCHNKIFKHWEETGHASAYETLVKAGHEYDPECLSCHTIGLHYYSGFETIEITPNMKDVGCESCHGPGSDHKETQSKDYGKADEEVCMACHEAEHSPKFHFEEYWRKIKHPPDDMKRSSYN